MDLRRDYEVPVSDINNNQGHICVVELEPELKAKVTNLANTLNVTPFIIYLCMYEMVLKAYSQQDDVVVGIPVANRNVEGTLDIVGLFVNTIALRLRADIIEGPSLVEHLQLVATIWKASRPHHGCAFDEVVGSLGALSSAGSTPVFQEIFNFLPYTTQLQ